MLPLLLAFGAVAAPPPAAPPPTSADKGAASAAHAAPPARRPRDDDDDAEGKVAPGSPLVVTGRRLDAARTGIYAALGATLYTLTNDAIENRPGGETGRIAQILAQAPGVAAQGDRISIRGTRAVQLRINDVVVPEAIRDPQERLGARLAATTRLLTGTLPAQFGFAPGGVISVTTKSGLYEHGGQAELFAGSRGFVEPAAEWSGSVGGMSLFASGSFERDRNTLAAADRVEGRDARREAGGLAFADLVLDPHDRVSLLLGGSDERHRIGGTALGPGVEHGSAGYAVGTFQHSDDGFSLQASLFAAVATDRVGFRIAGRDHRRSVGTQIDATQSLGPGNRLRAGLLASHADESENDPRVSGARAGRTPLALYVQDEWKIAPTLTFNPGVRAEWLRGPADRAVVEPRASLVWAADEDVTAHAGYSRYAAAPPLRGGRSADLPDETDDYYDVGAQRRAGPFTLGVDLYWRTAHNLLAEHETPGAAAATSFAYAHGRARGVELTATYARRATTAWANLAYSRATGRGLLDPAGIFPASSLAAASARQVPLASDRPLTASAGFTHRLDELTLSADVLVSSGAVRTLDLARPNGARAPAYALLGLAAVYHARLAGHAADFRLDLTNLADVRTIAADGTALEGGWTRGTKGRAIVVGVEQGF